MARQSRSIQTEVKAMRSSLKQLQRTVERLSKKSRQLERAASDGGSPAGRKLTISPKRRAALRLQGAYMGHMRQLSERQKQRVRKVKEKSGYHPAIKLAQQLAGK